MGLKGSVSRDFLPPFFPDSNPFGPLINGLKYFRIWFRFRRDNLRSVQHTAELRISNLEKKLPGVQHTAETISVHTAETISAVCNTLQQQSRKIPRSPGLQVSKKISAVCITLKRCNKPHVRDDPSNVQHTVEMIFKVCNTPYCFKKLDVFRS